MSNGQHTPGPWIWGENYNGLYGAGKDSEVLSHADYEGMWLAYSGRKANASLIAAAPDLLAELDMIRLSFGGGRVITFSDADIDRIEAACAKAKGQDNV